MPAPSVLATQRLEWPPLSERYVTSVPSGLTDGVRTWPVCRVIRTAARALSAGAPVTGTFQISDWLRIRATTMRPDWSTSASTYDTSPKVMARSFVP
jgi:hypothetical protein